MKSKMKKLFSVMMAVATSACLSLTAFAADEEKTTATNATVTHTYELYQIFTGTYDSTTASLSNMKWGQNASVPTGSKVGDAVPATDSETVVDAAKLTSDTAKLEVIKKYADLTSDPYRGADAQPTADATNTTYTYSDVTPGYYLIKDAEKSLDNKAGAYTLYVVKVSSGTLVFEPKGSAPTVTKKVETNEEVWSSNNSASIGEDIQYKLTGTISSRIADFNTYYYKFTDTLSKGLTYTKDSVKVYLNEVSDANDITKYFYINASANTDGTTKLVVAIQDLKELENVKDGDAAKYTLTANTKIIVTYHAALNENAVINDANTNEVIVDYSNDPNNSGTPSTDTPEENPKDEPTPDKNQPTGETAKAVTKTFTTALQIEKINSSGDKLTGAVFSLTGEGVKQMLVTQEVFEEDEAGTYYLLNDGTYTETAPNTEGVDTTVYADTEKTYAKKTELVLKGENTDYTTVEGTVDSKGVITFTGLGEGEYTLTEVTAPTGYNKIDPITFTVEYTYEDGTVTFSVPDRDSIRYSDKDGMLHTSVIDYRGGSLPNTGGIGTTIFYIVGGILLAGASILLITRKRMQRVDR
jgi:fimbrial isopeptide formation D2 family protein/LPXTG-motif cell wall-anchored protein